MKFGNERSFLAVFLFLAVLEVININVPAYAAGTTYYVDNRSSSNCSDNGAHTVNQPWCSFAPVNKLKTFLAGDQILLARGGTWDQEMTITGSGTSADPIILAAYGEGANPKILRNQAISDICVLLTDGSNWKISDLEVGRASVGILLHYTQLFNSGISISNIYAHDNKGIWSGYSTDHPVRRKVEDPFAADLNINLSSGILFNISSDLTFSSSQYILKGISVSNVLGTNNVDSVAFDAETNTLDNQDGHNAFQDVDLNGLFLFSDNGHASTAYQRAGLGCSDSLRLLGMMNVTLLNSVLFDESACHTATGTAAVILGRVSDVTFVNNIFFGVPATSSPDETGIDLEWSETHVDLHANMFAGNAGPGVEILNIHRGDHSDRIEFYDNTFANNSRTFRPGAASIWEDNKGRGYAWPTGFVRNNFYSEPNGRFFAGRSIGSITNSNNVATSSGASYAAQQFSSAQGANQWRYMYETSDSTWTNIPKFSPRDYNGAWEVSPAQYVSAFNLAPARSGGNWDTGGVARAWVAPRRGTISLRGRVLKSDARGGTGVYAVINLVSGRNVTQIVNNISVSPGDTIRFEITANGNNSYDTVSWTPSVAYVPSAVPTCSNLNSIGDRQSALRGGASRLQRDCLNFK